MSQKWLYSDSPDDFESTMNTVAKHIAGNERRFGISPMANVR